MADIEVTIANALAAARTDGVLEAEGGDEGEVVAEPTETDETADEGTGDEGETAEAEEDSDEEPAEGDEAEGNEEEAEGDEEKPEEADEEESTEEVDPVLGPALDKDGKVNRIPHPRVVKMVAKKIQGVTDIVGQALGYEKGKVTTENIAQALGQVQALRDYYTEMQEIEPVMRTNGKEFIARLAKANPEQYGRYAEIDAEGYTAPSAAAGKVSADNEMPRPDVPITLPDGTKGFTYSQEGMDKRDQWLVNKAVAMATDALGKKLKPYEDERATAKADEQKSLQLATTINELLGEARSEWDGFTENEKEIQKAYDQIPKSVPFARALRQAYNKVVIQKYKADRAKTRKELIEEGNRAATKKVTTKGKVVAKKEVVRNEDGEAVTGTEATIRKSLANARAAGTLK